MEVRWRRGMQCQRAWRPAALPTRRVKQLLEVFESLTSRRFRQEFQHLRDPYLEQGLKVYPLASFLMVDHEKNKYDQRAHLGLKNLSESRRAAEIKTRDTHS